MRAELAVRDSGSALQPLLADVQGGIEVPAHRLQVAVGDGVAAGHFAHQQEVLLAEVDRELGDRSAEVPGLLEGDVLDRVDPDPAPRLPLPALGDSARL